jgi:hypothetical protein
MNLIKVIKITVCVLILHSCADYKNVGLNKKKEKHYFSSTGFALIFEDDFFKQKVINKKLNNDDIKIMHNLLKTNTPVKIINPANSIVVETKIYKKAIYPKIFNVVISKKIASILDLDPNNPYVEIIEMKKNKVFIAKKSNTFEEERNVAEKAPVEEIEVNNLSEKKTENNKKKLVEKNFILVINDFYYEDSANKLKLQLIKKSKMMNLSVKKINDKKYRLFAGPFKNFNTLKTTYISLNNLGFENLNVYKD